MKKNLRKISEKVFHVVDGKMVCGIHSGISGDVSGISGNVDECELTDDEKKAGVDILALVDDGEDDRRIDL